MRNFLFLTIFIISIITNAQSSGYVEYRYIINLGIDYETTGLLQFTNDKSKFTQLKSGDSNTVKNLDELEITVISESDDRPINFISRNSKMLLSYVPLFKKIYLTQEKIPKINWSIKNEFKALNNIQCQKAEGYFRGRTYIVWFTKDIPVSFGPWKLQGLPGLILEARDEKMEIFFKAKRIKLGSSFMIDFPNIENSIRLREFIEMKAKIYKEKSEMIKSKMPRNASFTLPLPPRSSQKEIVFEWEEEKEKQD